MTIPIKTRLSYPDPFQPSGVEFDLNCTAHVTIEIINETGLLLETLISEKLYQPGTHHVDFNASESFDRILYFRVIVKRGLDQYIETKPLISTKQAQKVP